MNIFQNLLPKSLDFPRPNPTSRHSCAVSWRSWKGPPRCVAAPERNVRRSLGRRSTLSPWNLRLSPLEEKEPIPMIQCTFLWLAAERCHHSTHHNKSLGTDNATERGDQMPCCGESMAKLNIFCLWCRTNMWMKPRMPNTQLTRVPGMMLMTNTTNTSKCWSKWLEDSHWIRGVKWTCSKYASGRIPKHAQAHRLVYVGFLFLNGKH